MAFKALRDFLFRLSVIPVMWVFFETEGQKQTTLIQTVSSVAEV